MLFLKKRVVELVVVSIAALSMVVVWFRATDPMSLVGAAVGRYRILSMFGRGLAGGEPTSEVVQSASPDSVLSRVLIDTGEQGSEASGRPCLVDLGGSSFASDRILCLPCSSALAPLMPERVRPRLLPTNDEADNGLRSLPFS